MGSDEVDDDLRKFGLVGDGNAAPYVLYYLRCAFLRSESLMVIDTGGLILNETHRILRLSDIVIQRAYPEKHRVCADYICGLFGQIGYLQDKLDVVADWSHVLSVGEQQRLAFVRAHIQEPLWLFLDEATSALDEDTEAKMYELLGARLSSTTVVSVGHRSTLNKYHQLVLSIDKDSKNVALSSNI